MSLYRVRVVQSVVRQGKPHVLKTRGYLSKGRLVAVGYATIYSAPSAARRAGLDFLAGKLSKLLDTFLIEPYS